MTYPTKAQVARTLELADAVDKRTWQNHNESVGAFNRAARTELPDYARAYDGAMRMLKEQHDWGCRNCVYADWGRPRGEDEMLPCEAAAAIAAWEREE